MIFDEGMDEPMITTEEGGEEAADGEEMAPEGDDMSGEEAADGEEMAE